MRGRTVIAIVIALVVVVVGVVAIAAYVGTPRYAYLPPMEKVLNPQRFDVAVRYETAGRSITAQEARQIIANKDDPGQLSPERGAVKVDEELLQLGRRTFYEETFGNEIFLSDVMGILDGPLRPYQVLRAVLDLRGQGTTNLRVRLAERVTIGGVTYRKGSRIDTGLDVAKGSSLILGIPVRVARGRIQAGITCAACHSTVDPQTGMVIDGATNTDLNIGLLMALATNSSAYFPHAEIPSLAPFVRDRSRTVASSASGSVALPDPQALEAAVDAVFASWPPGNFDSTIDMVADPTQIPDSFTLGDHPYGWSGFAAVGPFRGLSAFCNNVHAQNSDALAQADVAQALFGIDKELYLATILQNAANPHFRFDPAGAQTPSEFFASVDPTPEAPGMNELVKPPGFPEVTWIAPDGMFVGSPGHNVWEQNNAMAAWQNLLVPPAPPISRDEGLFALGRSVFLDAGCAACHSGNALTDNRVISAPLIGTEPTRAKALKKTEMAFGPPLAFTFDTPVPVPRDAKVMVVSMRGLDPQQLELGWAHGNSPGGYKVPSLLGLHWSAPYLHDGGVAVGADAGTQVGVASTLMRGVAVDPAASLFALIDRTRRAAVVDANVSSPALLRVRVIGSGHEKWIDTQSGFNSEDQKALLHYLLTLQQVQ